MEENHTNLDVGIKPITTEETTTREQRIRSDSICSITDVSSSRGGEATTVSTTVNDGGSPESLSSPHPHPQGYTVKDLTKIHYKRVHPRIGNQYQTRICRVHNVEPISSPRSARPKPHLYSNVNPHTTENEVIQHQKEFNDNNNTIQASLLSSFNDVDDNNNGNNNRQQPGSDPPSPWWLHDQLPTTTMTRRGGLCIHRGSTTTSSTVTIQEQQQQHDDYLTFCQNLMIPQDPDETNNNPNGRNENNNNSNQNDSNTFDSNNHIESFKQEMIEQYGNTTNGTPTKEKVRRRGGGNRQNVISNAKNNIGTEAKVPGRRGRKRKQPKQQKNSEKKQQQEAEENPYKRPYLKRRQSSLASDISTATSTITTTSTTTSVAAGAATAATTTITKRVQHLAEEDNELMLQYLHLNHNGNVESARLGVMVNLQSGRAVKSRKLMHIQKHNDRFKRPNIDTSLSWRKRYEELACNVDETKKPMLGDLRLQNNIEKTTTTTTTEEESSSSSDNNNITNTTTTISTEAKYPFHKLSASSSLVSGTSSTTTAAAGSTTASVTTNEKNGTSSQQKQDSVASAIAAAASQTYNNSGATAEETSSVISTSSDRDDMKGVWRSVLSCGQGIVRSLTEYCAAKTDTPYYYMTSLQKQQLKQRQEQRQTLSDIISFVRNAYMLPITPEECFGNRHIVVEQISICLHKILDYISRGRDEQIKLHDKLYISTSTQMYDEGIDTNALKKYVNDVDRKIPFVLDDEIRIVRQYIDDAENLQKRLDDIIDEENHYIHRIEDDSGKENRNVDIVANGSSNDAEDNNNNSVVADTLSIAEELAQEGRRSGLRSQNLVLLEKLIQKTYALRERIREWMKKHEQGKKESVKYIESMVKEAGRVDLSFPEMQNLIEFHRSMETWVDRANIAIRSRISLSEIELLIVKGDDMHLDLSDYIDKLRTRVNIAHEWIDRLKEKVPCPLLSEEEATDQQQQEESGSGGNKKVDNIKWMSLMREALWSGYYGVLHDMASEGSRIPVEIDCVKMLQLELDAKNWSVKAKKWIPQVNANPNDATGGESSSSSSTVRKAKLEDLRDHIDKAEGLREKLCLSEKEREAWVLDGEVELHNILSAADDWFDKYQPFLEFDNRRNEKRNCISMTKLRTIVKEASLIHANLGNASSKVSRILAQAEAWYEKYNDLLCRCGLTDSSSSIANNKKSLSVTEMNAAVEDANSSIPLDIEEATQIKCLSDKIQSWFDRALLAAPKRSKRSVRGKASPKSRHSLDDLVCLIEEAPSLPADTDADVERLKMQLSLVQSFRLQAQNELGEIAKAFNGLRTSVNVTYGEPEEFLRKEIGAIKQVPVVSSSSSEDDSNNKASRTTGDDEVVDAVVENVARSESPDVDPSCISEDASRSDSCSGSDSVEETGVKSRLGGGGGIHRLVTSLLKDAKATGIYTAEEKTAEVLEKVSKWCVRSLKYVSSPKDVFERKEYVAFNKFVSSGQDLFSLSKAIENEIDAMIEDVGLIENLNSSWCGVLSDQLMRLRALQTFHSQFTTWSNNAEQVLKSTEKKIPMDYLLNLVEESSHYPAALDIVQKIRNRAKTASLWAKKTKELIHSDTKMSLQEAKDRFEEGEKLNVACNELKMLRNAIREARSWAARVKKSKLESGGTNVSAVQDLVAAHDTLLISMPDTVQKLMQAMKGYCICRRPYSGFMVACDECDEWYHGACIGVNETQAGKVEKYVCVRCGVARVFKASSATVVSVIRKWVSSKDHKKARQLDGQKHQRKVRKENRDIEKLEPEIEALLKSRERLQSNGENQINGSADPSNTPGGPHGQLPVVNAPLEDAKETNQASEPGKTKESSDGNVAEKAVSEDSRRNADGNDTTEANAKENGTKGCSSKLSEEEIEAKLKKARAALQHCHNRLELLAKQAAVRKVTEDKEDKMHDVLRMWCVKVCMSVLIPLTTDLAEQSRPNRNGSQSLPMVSIAKEADTLGISQFADVRAVLNCFGCIAWSYSAMSVVKRKPIISEIKSLVDQLSSLKLPEEKAARILKSLLQRATAWQLRVSKVLAPKPGETEPCCLVTLKELQSHARDIPVRLPEESRLRNAIDDNGARHCVCGGPSDGSFMMGCDKCDRWFHGHCVNVDEEVGDSLKEWVCPPCSGTATTFVHQKVHGKHHIHQHHADDSDNDEDVAPNAPNPIKLWPPCGLLNSPKAYESLGGDCTSILLRSPVSATNDATSTTEQMNPKVYLTNAEQTRGGVPILAGVPCNPQSSQVIKNSVPFVFTQQVNGNIPLHANVPFNAQSNQVVQDSRPTPMVVSQQFKESIGATLPCITQSSQCIKDNTTTIVSQQLNGKLPVHASALCNTQPSQFNTTTVVSQQLNGIPPPGASVHCSTQSSQFIKNKTLKVVSQQFNEKIRPQAGVPCSTQTAQVIKEIVPVAVSQVQEGISSHVGVVPQSTQLSQLINKDNAPLAVTQQVKEKISSHGDAPGSTNTQSSQVTTNDSAPLVVSPDLPSIDAGVIDNQQMNKETVPAASLVPPGTIENKEINKASASPALSISGIDNKDKRESSDTNIRVEESAPTRNPTEKVEDGNLQQKISTEVEEAVAVAGSRTEGTENVNQTNISATTTEIQHIIHDDINDGGLLNGTIGTSATIDDEEKTGAQGPSPNSTIQDTRSHAGDTVKMGTCPSSTSTHAEEQPSSTIVFLSASLQLQKIHLKVEDNNAVAVKVSDDHTPARNEMEDKVLSTTGISNQATMPMSSNAAVASIPDSTKVSDEKLKEHNVNVSSAVSSTPTSMEVVKDPPVSASSDIQFGGSPSPKDQNLAMGIAPERHNLHSERPHFAGQVVSDVVVPIACENTSHL